MLSRPSVMCSNDVCAEYTNKQTETLWKGHGGRVMIGLGGRWGCVLAVLLLQTLEYSFFSGLLILIVIEKKNIIHDQSHPNKIPRIQSRDNERHCKISMYRFRKGCLSLTGDKYHYTRTQTNKEPQSRRIFPNSCKTDYKAV